MKILLIASVLVMAGLFGWPTKFFEYAEGTPSEAILLPADGKVFGKVFFSKAAAATNRSSKGLYGKSTSRLTQAGGAQSDKRAVVYIVKVPGKFNAPQSHPAMRQKNVSIVPRVLPIIAGTTVDFPNEDEIFHNIFSLSPGKNFDLGRYAKGVSKSVTFSTLGNVKVFCDIHSNMGGTILVLQNPYFTITQGDGSYTLSGVPTGTFDLTAWSESGGSQTQKITVASGAGTETTFSF